MPELMELTRTEERRIADLAGAIVGTAGGVEADAPHTTMDRLVEAIGRRIRGSFSTVAEVRALLVQPKKLRRVTIKSWFDAAEERLNQIASAQENWDGYGAPTIKAATVLAALSFLSVVESYSGNPPAIVPTGLGNVQLEWRSGTTEIEVEIESSYAYCATLWISGQEIHEWIGDVRGGINPDLARAISLTGRVIS